MLQQGLSREEFEGMVDRFLADCAAQEGASADDIKYLKERNLPTTKGQMCISACVGENLGFVSIENLKISRSKKLKISFHIFQQKKIAEEWP